MATAEDDWNSSINQFRASETSDNISLISNRCIDELDHILDTARSVDDTNLQPLEDSRARFLVWAANIGALKLERSTASLDHRLKHAPAMRETVLMGLRRLLRTTIRAFRIIRGISVNRVSDTVPTLDVSITQQKPPTNELHELLLGIDSCISHLLSLSILIRRQRPKGRLPQLDDYQPVDESPDISNVMDKFPKVKEYPWLAKRLGNGTSQRRQIMSYRQLHRKRLDRRRETYIDEGHDSQDSATIQRTVMASTIATTFDEETVSKGTSEDEPVDNAKDRVSMMTSATSFLTGYDDMSMGRHIPDLSDMVLDGVQLDYETAIECPYCRTVQVVADRQDWKKHVYSDLQPYVCTFQHCSSSSRLFSTRSEWLHHETTAHGSNWICIRCKDKTQPFTTAEAMESHFMSAHSSEITMAQLPMLLEACERPGDGFGTTSCPLCDEWKPLNSKADTKNFGRHLARHLQLLALDALPLAVEGLEIRDPDNEHNSQESDLESGRPFLFGGAWLGSPATRMSSFGPPSLGELSSASHPARLSQTPSQSQIWLNEAMRSISSRQMDRERERIRGRAMSSGTSYNLPFISRRNSLSPTSPRAGNQASRIRHRSPSPSSRRTGDSNS